MVKFREHIFVAMAKIRIRGVARAGEGGKCPPEQKMTKKIFTPFS